MQNTKHNNNNFTKMDVEARTADIVCPKDAVSGAGQRRKARVKT